MPSLNVSVARLLLFIVCAIALSVGIVSCLSLQIKLLLVELGLIAFIEVNESLIYTHSTTGCRIMT